MLAPQSPEQLAGGRNGQSEPGGPPLLRFGRIGITSIFGSPEHATVWSAAPYNLANALSHLGIEVERFSSGHTRWGAALLGLSYLSQGLGRPDSMEDVLRSAPARQAAARRIRHIARERNLRHILHTGTLDLPDETPGLCHYLYCDHNWALALRHRPAFRYLPKRALRMFEELERRALLSLTHIFTFGEYVRQHMIEHYGVDPTKVTAVGCGMGKIEPYFGPKEYGVPNLLFVAKHLFVAKGGLLLDQAFRIAHRQRPDLRLTIVGDPRNRALVQPHPAIEMRDHLSWDELQRLFRQSTLLVQPMLNDPWGQVYTEALISRTPVIGLNRNGLPEIIEHGRHGFLVDQADPQALARTILDAVSDPLRLERMGHTGQTHVMQSYSWDQVAKRIAYVPEVPAAR